MRMKQPSTGRKASSQTRPASARSSGSRARGRPAVTPLPSDSEQARQVSSHPAAQALLAGAMLGQGEREQDNEIVSAGQRLAQRASSSSESEAEPNVPL